MEVQVKLKGYPASYMSPKGNILTSVTVEIALFLSYKFDTLRRIFYPQDTLFI